MPCTGTYGGLILCQRSRVGNRDIQPHNGSRFSRRSDAGSRSQETHLKAHCDVVRITHPAHPLRGQSFPVVRRQSKENALWVEIQLANGEGRLIPLDWTDQSSSIVTLPEARFLLANLLTLRQRVDSVLQTAQESDILPLNHTQGGSDETRNPISLVQVDRQPTCPDHCLSGPDSAASIDATRGR